MRRYIHHRRTNDESTFHAQQVGQALRRPLRKAGAKLHDEYDGRTTEYVSQRHAGYQIRIHADYIPWAKVRFYLRRELAGADGWALKNYLYHDYADDGETDEPSRVAFELARPALLRIWDALHYPHCNLPLEPAVVKGKELEPVIKIQKEIIQGQWGLVFC